MMTRPCLAAALALVMAPACAAPTAKPAAAQLPERLLTCTVARATRYDGGRSQRLDELGLEGSHRIELALPSVPVRTTPPPEAIDPPEPVALGTRILADPDGIAKLATRFDRVVDLWPDRVELSTEVTQRLAQLIIVASIDPVAGTAQIQLAQANETMNYNPDEVYLGPCKVLTKNDKTAVSQ